MTTELDRVTPGGTPNRLPCNLEPSGIHPTLALALRDMRLAHGRDPVTGDGPGGDSWVGLVLGMVVLDTLSGNTGNVGERFQALLAQHGVPPADAAIIYRLRCSLLHGYGLPSRDQLDGRKIALTNNWDDPAVDTSDADQIRVSVPVFCGFLVERIARAAGNGWDDQLIDTGATIGGRRPTDHGDLSFRPLDLETLRVADPAVSGFTFCDQRTGGLTPMTPEEWTKEVTAAGELSDEVPDQVRGLFEAARGAIGYGVFFYPLLAIGSSHLRRACSAAAHLRCEQLGRRAQRSGDVLAVLDEAGILDRDVAHASWPGMTRTSWEATLYLAERSENPKFQEIIMPTDALLDLAFVRRQLNELFARPVR